MAKASKKQIVLIDDDPDILESVGTVLNAAGFEVKTALNGQEGLELIRKNKPDLILCDLMMETVDAGIKVADHVHDMGVRIPFYLLSSVGDATNANLNVREMGVDGTIQKPMVPAQLIDLVKNALQLR
jgi:CheY-like chemotaxis protein